MSHTSQVPETVVVVFITNMPFITTAKGSANNPDRGDTVLGDLWQAFGSIKKGPIDKRSFIYEEQRVSQTLTSIWKWGILF